MKLLEYLSDDVQLYPGLELFCPIDNKPRTLIQYPGHGYATALNGRIASDWYQAKILAEFNTNFWFDYTVLKPEVKYVEKGDMISYGKDDDRLVVRIGDNEFGLLNQSTNVINIRIQTKDSRGITLKDWINSGFIIGDSITITRGNVL